MSNREGDRLRIGARAARAADERAISAWGIPSFALMESAGRACVDVLERRFAEALSEPVWVLCGPGNNGGDGLVVARTLVNRGHAARVFAAGGVARLEAASPDVQRNLALWRGLGESVDELSEPDDLSAAGVADARGVVVDALFGTGLARALTNPFAEWIAAVQASARPVLAVDLPSGLDADDGSVHGVALPATVTVSFVAEKAGFHRGRGPDLTGEVVVAEIGIPEVFAREAAERFPPGSR